ncbi:sensor histidine kinase [Aquimarina longa]|uniref:sensor histidine kinase n=1 Tax=Aquimarina longa TaxID=1080221 RepID=UPI000A7CB38A|nr:sensor histidine kinase [Aquimarina longa]
MSYVKRIEVYFSQSKYSFHIVFWVSTLLFFSLRDELEENHNIVRAFVYSAFLMIPQLLASYSLAYYLIPKFIYTKRYLSFLGLFVFSAYFFSVLARVFTVHLAEPLVRKRPFDQESILEILVDLHYLTDNYFPLVYTVVLVFLMIRFIVDISKVKQQNLELEKEKATTELKILKAQLHPHFLFNTLNNIYMLSLENSPKTPESIEKLSEILDYVLYRCNTKFVLVSNEISFLKNYITLEKLRYDERLQVTIHTSIERGDIVIAPLILLSLVENAFKHGAGEDSGSPRIDISIDYEDSLFTFRITNSIASSAQIKPKIPIGLTNIRKQLDLIYLDSYTMDIEEQENLFTVTLEIKV